MTVNVPLTPHLKAFLRQQLATGRYESETEVIRAALSLMEEQAIADEADAVWLKKELDKGLTSPPSEPMTKTHSGKACATGWKPTQLPTMKPDRLIHKNSQASADINGLSDYYRRKAGMTIARRFVDNAEQAFERLAGHAKHGRTRRPRRVTL